MTKYNFNFVGIRRVWYSLVGIMVLIGMAAMIMNWLNPAIKAPLKFGIDFTGGTEVRVVMPSADFSREDVAAKLSKLSLSRESLKKSENELIISSERKDEAFGNEIIRILSSEYGVKPADISIDMVGPSIGRELQRNAIIALLLGMAGILLYVTFRYDFKFAAAAIAALFHDVYFIIAFFAVTRLDVNSYFVPVLLTIVGYSINDTIVIFDRIRENLKLDKRADFAELVNRSINQTLTRSINTNLTTTLTILALLLFGGSSIHTFALALFVGCIAGSYSTIFIASQLLVSWKLAEHGGGRKQASPGVMPRAAAGYSISDKDVRPETEAGVPESSLATATPVVRKRPRKQKRR